MKLFRVDPLDCGCTDCITGESKPLSMITQDELIQLLRGQLQDSTSHTLTVSPHYEWSGGELVLTGTTVSTSWENGDLLRPETVSGNERTWELDSYDSSRLLDELPRR